MNTTDFAAIIEQFHFLRPEWFYALIPAVLLFLIIKVRQGMGSNWEKTIDPELLPHLIEDTTSRVSTNPLYLILLAWCLVVVSLAGPVWEKTPQPVHEREDALVIIFDLTRSMYATDVKPNRLVRAKRKLLDLLDQRTEGVTALIVYAGDAHTVTPLTDDTGTIAEMIPVITPEIMPSPGSKLVPALESAESLFRNAGMMSGRILIVTDEIRDTAQAQSFARGIRNAFPVSVLAVGTTEGGTIPSETFAIDGELQRDSNGAIVRPRVNFAALEDFAAVAGGRFAKMRLDDNDLAYLLAEQVLLEDEAFREVERDFDIWFEEGPWILLILLPLAAFSFRRGWLWSLFFVCFLPVPEAEASLWDDMWKTKDQQAAEALREGDADSAATLFEDPQWKGTAHYKNKNFDSAQLEFSQNQTSDGRYNFANALAKQGKYQESIEAYDQALTLNPDNEDASFNKQLIEKLLESKEEEQSEENSEDSEKGDESEEEQENQNQDEQNQDQESENQQQGQEEEEEAKDKEAEKQKEAEENEKDKQEQEAKDQQMSDAEPEPLNEEEEQALQQWLRRVPDDPGGLLRRKFKMQYDSKNDGKKKDESSNW
ncbi:MAG: Ca-activated chloride channel family protein [Candidatus Azotimanducaceae bacterium]|jgi:Ca-activated chloride channel family protein